MITIKTKEEIEILREGGRRLASILRELSGRVVPGVSSMEIDRMAKVLAESTGDIPAFWVIDQKVLKNHTQQVYAFQ